MKKKLKQYEIIDHRVKANKYPVTYVSKEIVREPDGSPRLTRHGQPEMRDIEEKGHRFSKKLLFTVDCEDSVIEFMTVPELVAMGGRKQFSRNLRTYKQQLKETQSLAAEENA